jgi:hypothetical protein
MDPLAVTVGHIDLVTKEDLNWSASGPLAICGVYSPPLVFTTANLITEELYNPTNLTNKSQA